MVTKDHRDSSFLGCLGILLDCFLLSTKIASALTLPSALSQLGCEAQDDLILMTILGTFFGWGIFLHLDFNLRRVPPHWHVSPWQILLTH